MRDNLFYNLYNDIILEIHQNIQDVTGKDFNRGLSNEQKFDKCMRENGFISRDLGRQADLQHKDRLVTSATKHTGPSGKMGGDIVEIKGRKHNAASNLLIEVIGISGYAGWLYTEADFISFDVPEKSKIVLIPSDQLRKYVEKIGNFHIDSQFGRSNNDLEVIMNDNSRVQYASDTDSAILPKFHKRVMATNKDVVTRIPLVDILQNTKFLKFAYK